MKTMPLLILLASVAGTVSAQAPVRIDAQVPPALRTRPAEEPKAGAALRAQAMAKLQAQFRAADLDGDGLLTADEARAFGFVATHFEAIDSGRRGAVSFDDLRIYLTRVKADRR